MHDPDLAGTLDHLHALISGGEDDPERRDAADAEFRQRYRELSDLESVPDAAMDALRKTLLALVGDDDWRAAREHLEEARRLLHQE